MPTVIKNKWDGGHAEDLRTLETDECEKSLNFDVLTNPHKLIPYPDSIAETLSSGTMDDIEISDIEVSLISSTYFITGGGYEVGGAGSTKPAFYIKSDMVSNLAQQAVAAGNSYVKGSLVIYKDKAYALGFNGSNQYTLYRYNSAGSVTDCGNISSSSALRARPFVHPEDNMLYIIIGTSITRYNGTDNIGSGTSLTYTSILPTGSETTSICDYGGYLAIAMQPLRGNGSSFVYLWGRDGTINTLQGSIDFGEGSIRILENLNNNLFAVMTPQNGFSVTTNKLIVKAYSGGAVDTMRSIVLSDSTETLSYSKSKNGGKIYFGLTADDAVYAIGRNKSGKYILTKDRYFFNGTAIGTGGNQPIISMIGDVMWTAFTTVAGVWTLMRSRIDALGESFNFTSASTYKTTINPNMVEGDRYKDKKLTWVRLSYTGKANGTVKLKYSKEGGTMTSIIEETTTAIEDLKEATVQFDGKPFDSGKEFQFQIESTGRVEIKELAYAYDILPTQN